MKIRITALLIFTALVLTALTGCDNSFSGNYNRPENVVTDTEAYNEITGYADALNMTYSEFKKKFGYPVYSNSLCEYMINQNQMPSERTARIWLTDLSGLLGSFGDYKHPEGLNLDITSAEISVTKERTVSAFSKYFPEDELVKLTKSSSPENMWNRGLPWDYAEYKDSYAILADTAPVNPENGGYPSGTRVTIIYGDADGYDEAEFVIDASDISSDHIQITDEYVYFSAGGSITRITRDGGEIRTKYIDYSSIEGLPSDEHTLSSSFFIDGDYLFFDRSYIFYEEDYEVITEDSEYHTDNYIVAYDLRTDEYDVFFVDGTDDSERLFCYGDGLALMTGSYNEEGWDSTVDVRFFDIDREKCRITERENERVRLMDNSLYSIGYTNDTFYCVGGLLCGFMLNYSDSSYAYAEFDLKTGALETFVPFKLSRDGFGNQKNKYIDCDTMTMYESGLALSRYNCN